MKPSLSVVFTVCVFSGLLCGAELDDGDLDDMLDLGMNIDELTGKEREAAVRKLCSAEDPDVDVLCEVLLSGKDSAETKGLIYRTLSQHASADIFDKAKAMAESSDIHVKKYGVRLVGLARHPRSVATLLRLTQRRFMCDKGDIVDALGDTANKKAIPWLRQVKQNDEKLSKRAVFSLMRLGDSSVLPTFFGMYGKYAAELDHLYVYLPWAQKSKTPRRIARVKQNLKDHERDLRIMQGLLLKAPKSFIPDVAAHLSKSTDPYAITLVFNNLERMISSDSAADFLPLLKHRSTMLAQAVLGRACELGGEDVKKKVIDRLGGFAASEDKYLRYLAIRNWRLLPAGRGPAVLVEGLKDDSRMVRVECAEQLRRAGRTESLPALRAALAETNDHVMRFACQGAIHEIENPVAIPRD